MEWFENNLDNPYPNESDRINMCKLTGLSRKQLRVWLINTRKVCYLAYLQLIFYFLEKT